MPILNRLKAGRGSEGNGLLGPQRFLELLKPAQRLPGLPASHHPVAEFRGLGCIRSAVCLHGLKRRSQIGALHLMQDGQVHQTVNENAMWVRRELFAKLAGRLQVIVIHAVADEPA